MSAMAFAAKCHTAQRRKYDHTPYINHPIRVAAMVAEHPVATTETVVAALLHDVIEDCPVSYNDIAAMNFGPRVPDLVLSLTERRTPGNRKQRILTECQRLSKESDETKIVKLCDRIDNVHDLKSHLVTKKISAGFCNIYVNESLQLVDFIGGADESLANVITEHCRDIKSVLDKIT
jgi:guanosine-3',5'-bis(diphosphate) 3'-pyrophosphohydrolase